MRDLAIIAFLAGLLALGFKRPFLFTLAYLYVDTVSPHRISYYLLNSLPLSNIVAAAAIGGWLVFDARHGFRVTIRQGLIAILLLYCWFTTTNALVPAEAALKWDWVWKTLVFALFLPLTLRTRLRVEAALLFLLLSAAVIVIAGGIKTVLGGGGYGQLSLLVSSNSGLYEGSTISAIAVALIPVILWFARHGTIFAPDRFVRLFAAGLVFACLLMPVGTEARTGLVCVAALGVLMLRDVKRRGVYIGAVLFAGLVTAPLLPQSFQERMGLIQGYQQDSSAASRLAVWGWTIEFAGQHPLGGGFGAYHTNKLQVETVAVREEGGVRSVTTTRQVDEGRAWHSAFFEMLGEQGWPGLLLFLLIHGIGLVRMEGIRRRYRGAEGDKAWIAPLATALQHFQIVYLVGALFVAIAFTPFIFLMLGVQIGFDTVIRSREKADRPSRSWAARPASASVPAQAEPA
jgi:probable O-glycosylation ligase (exosortase A-associated)